MRKKHRRTPIMLALAGLVASLATFVSSGTAAAVDTAALKWPAVNIGQYPQHTEADPKGNVTIGCGVIGTGVDSGLRTYSSTGQLIRDIPRSSPEGDNCIWWPSADKNGDIYGYSRDQGDLLAYSGNTLKWRYATSCASKPAVGADGNIYVAAEPGRLIALSPNVASGQTQPTKVRDVPIDAPCGAGLTPFKDGLVGRADGTTFVYFSYGGKKLATFETARRPVPATVNASGQLFYGNGSVVAAFDPITNTKKWSVDLSTFDHMVSISDVYATSDGGVVVKTTGTAPELIKLNVSGSIVKKSWSKTFPGVDSSGEFGDIQVMPNGHGKLALVRSANLSTNDPATKVPAIGVAVLDAISGEILYNRTLQGNLDAANGGLYGYQLDGDFSRGLAIGVDTVYVRAKCVGACSDTAAKLFPINVSGMRLDYPRGSVLASQMPMQPDAVPYVAMGDSFSSGEGNRPFLDESTCHRSTQAYSRVLGQDPYTILQLDKFVACSGAETTHVLNGWNDANHSELPQVDRLSANTKIVSITVGGNDIGFGSFGMACVLSNCDFDSAEWQHSTNEIAGPLGGKLQDTYLEILERTRGSGAQIYVMGYPHVIADKQVNDGYDARCTYMIGRADDPDYVGRYWEEARAARDIVDRLNTRIEQMVDSVRTANADNARLHFVPVTEDDSPFKGHEICGSGESFFHNVDQAANNQAFVFHPNAKGQQAYAKLLREAIGE